MTINNVFAEDDFNEFEELELEAKDLRQEIAKIVAEYMEAYKPESPEPPAPPVFVANLKRNGHRLLAEYSNGKLKDMGIFVGHDGRDGRDGIDGVDGLNGRDGKNGKDGQIGVGLEDVTEKDGYLTFTFTDGQTKKIGPYRFLGENADSGSRGILLAASFFVRNTSTINMTKLGSVVSASVVQSYPYQWTATHNWSQDNGITFGEGGAIGGIGCNARFYTDGTDKLKMQIEGAAYVPGDIFSQNPEVHFQTFYVAGIGNIPYMRFQMEVEAFPGNFLELGVFGAGLNLATLDGSTTPQAAILERDHIYSGGSSRKSINIQVDDAGFLGTNRSLIVGSDLSGAGASSAITILPNGGKAGVGISNTSIFTPAYNWHVEGDFKVDGTSGFNGTNPIAKPTVTGSRGGNAALASLLTALANYGLITDSTTA
jgi:hypothetical protein